VSKRTFYASSYNVDVSVLEHPFEAGESARAVLGGDQARFGSVRIDHPDDPYIGHFGKSRQAETAIYACPDYTYSQRDIHV
jgi:hypothetical protein